MSKETEDEKARKTFTGWKLDLMRAVRADHKTTAGAKCAFAALMDHVNQDTKKAWPSEGSLAISLGCSVKSVRKYLANLVDAKWVKVDGRSDRGTTVYEIIDHRMNVVLDQMTIDIDRFRANEKERQAKNRQRRQKPDVTEHGVRLKPPLSRNTGSYASRNMGSYEHLHGTPSLSSSSEEGGNIYAKQSKGF